MRESCRSRTLRFASGIISVMMLVIVLLSAFYIAAEANHTCACEDCPVCAVMQQCENTLRRFGRLAEQLSLSVLSVIFVVVVFVLFYNRIFAVTFDEDFS